MARTGLFLLLCLFRQTTCIYLVCLFSSSLIVEQWFAFYNSVLSSTVEQWFGFCTSALLLNLLDSNLRMLFYLLLYSVFSYCIRFAFSYSTYSVSRVYIYIFATSELVLFCVYLLSTD